LRASPLSSDLVVSPSGQAPHPARLLPSVGAAHERERLIYYYVLL
jgi:hypothetical protein